MAKKTFLALIYFFVILCFANNKMFADRPIVKGYYIDNHGVKFEVMILVPTGTNSDKIPTAGGNGRLYFTIIDKNEKKTDLYATDVKEYGFHYQDEDFRFHSFPDHKGQSYMGMKLRGGFLRVIYMGACNLYETIVAHHGAKSNYTSLEFVFWRSDHDTFTTGTGLFKRSGKGSNDKSFENFFADCPELSKKIKNNEFKEDDNEFINIAKFYNTNCQKSTKGSHKK